MTAPKPTPESVLEAYDSYVSKDTWELAEALRTALAQRDEARAERDQAFRMGKGD